MFFRRVNDQEKRLTPKYTCVCVKFMFSFSRCVYLSCLIVLLLLLASHANALAKLTSLLALYSVRSSPVTGAKQRGHCVASVCQDSTPVCCLTLGTVL